MQVIAGYIKVYFQTINKSVLAACTLLAGLLIYLNYRYGIDSFIESQNSVAASFYFRYLVFLIALSLPYAFYYLLAGKNYFKSSLVSFLIIISPALFSWKIAMSTELPLSSDYRWNYYWNQVVYWPLRLLVLMAMLFVFWKIFYRGKSFFGLTAKNFSWKPYLILLLMMTPLVAAASTQADFLRMYPKLSDVNEVLDGIPYRWFYHLLHELSYGSDFISVELFFRGFLVLAFVQVAGKDAILPMACYYCTIHFGKPLGECISSYFGGILLGIIVYNTRSIAGGLVVHLGIAWLMELGGYIGNQLK
jgi:hypothetical protein